MYSIFAMQPVSSYSISLFWIVVIGVGDRIEILKILLAVKVYVDSRGCRLAAMLYNRGLIFVIAASCRRSRRY